MASINGTSGNDNLTGTAQADTINAGAGWDNIYGGAGDDLIIAGAGNDDLEGGTGDDHLYGGDGKDFFVGSEGADWLFGGAGSDMAWFQDSEEAVQVDLIAGIGHGGTAEGDHYSSIERLWGSGLGDLLIGAETGTYFEGLNGNDTMIGHGGADHFDAQDWENGSDIITGGGGADYIDGGSANAPYVNIDTAAYLQSRAGVTVDLITGIGYDGDAAGDRLYNIENLVGSAHDDTFKGGLDANKLEGGGGDDVLWGRGGEDRLIGGDGNDLLEGNTGHDFLFGGAGADKFAFLTMQDSSTYTFAADEIVDFSHAGGDKIDLSWLDAKASTLGDQAFAFVGKAGFSAEGQVGYLQILGNTYVQVNQTGASASDMTIKISGLHDLVASDFIG